MYLCDYNKGWNWLEGNFCIINDEEKLEAMGYEIYNYRPMELWDELKAEGKNPSDYMTIVPCDFVAEQICEMIENHPDRMR